MITLQVITLFHYVNSFFSLFADMFLQHLDTDLTEEDVQKITTGSKTKTKFTVLTAHNEQNIQ